MTSQVKQGRVSPGGQGGLLGRHSQRKAQLPYKSYSVNIGRVINNVRDVFGRGWSAGGPAWGEGEEGGQPSVLGGAWPEGREDCLGEFGQEAHRGRLKCPDTGRSEDLDFMYRKTFNSCEEVLRPERGSKQTVMETLLSVLCFLTRPHL